VVHKTHWHFPDGSMWLGTASFLMTLIVILILFLSVFVGRTG
jgi:hypothetical protein